MRENLCAKIQLKSRHLRCSKKPQKAVFCFFLFLLLLKNFFPRRGSFRRNFVISASNKQIPFWGWRLLAPFVGFGGVRCPVSFRIYILHNQKMHFYSSKLIDIVQWVFVLRLSSCSPRFESRVPQLPFFHLSSSIETIFGVGSS